MKRSGKFWYRNEKQTLEALGFQQIPGSGNGFAAKEDGENEFALVQLKSTDKSSYTLDLLDLKKLEFHAEVDNKIPLFLIQYLKANKIYAVIEVSNIADLKDIIETGNKKESKVMPNAEASVLDRRVKSSSKAIQSYRKEQERRWQKKK